jgi:hypothetical protein
VSLLEDVIGMITEAASKPGIMSLAGIKREKACRKDIASYFDVLWNELEKLDLSKAADAAHKESALHSAEISIRRAMRQTQPVLLHALAGHIYLALLDGDKVARRQMKQEFKEAIREKRDELAANEQKQQDATAKALALAGKSKQGQGSAPAPLAPNLSTEAAQQLTAALVKVAEAIAA